MRLTVSDTGCGIDEINMKRIFEPYFTTKEVDEGTGLGLAVVHGIIKNHGGGITVESRPHKGSCFHVYLPVVSKPKCRPAVQKTKTLNPGGRHILFVDDEEDLVNIARRNLESIGFKVSTSTSAEEALNLFKEAPDTFDLVITDQAMPHMTGFSLASELMRIKPKVPVVLCTGYSESITPDKVKSIGIREFVKKPLSKNVLRECITNALSVNKNRMDKKECETNG